MRYARYATFLSALTLCAGLFLPFVSLGVGGLSIGQKADLPLYTAVSKASLVRHLSSDVEEPFRQRLAWGLVESLVEMSGPLADKAAHLRAAAHDAEELHQDAHIKELTIALQVAGIVFLILLGLIAIFVLKGLSQRSPRRWQTHLIAALALVVGVVSGALFLSSQKALAMANEELGTLFLSFGTGGYLILLGGVALVASALSLWELERRHLRQGTS